MENTNQTNNIYFRVYYDDLIDYFNEEEQDFHFSDVFETNMPEEKLAGIIAEIRKDSESNVYDILNAIKVEGYEVRPLEVKSYDFTYIRDENGRIIRSEGRE